MVSFSLGAETRRVLASALGLLEGWPCRYLHALKLDALDYSVSVVSQARVAFIPFREINAMIESEPRLADALWRDTLIDAAIFREWLSGVGRRLAYERVAHLICELYVKLAAVDLTRNGAFNFPITQAELGDALGLSTVHVNRSLQELRRRGLIVSRSSRMEIPDFSALKAAGDFDPMYLNLKPRALAA